MPKQSSTRRRWSKSRDEVIVVDRPETIYTDKAVSRRRILKTGIGLAAVGAAGGSLLSEAFASPAAAATTTETGAVAPAVVALVDAPTIAVDASQGNDFRVTLGASRTMGNPANPVDGQKIVFQITQGGAGSSNITWGSGYEFSTGLPQPTLSTTVAQTDLLAFIYNAAKAKWLLAAFVSGFATIVVVQPMGTFRLFQSANGQLTNGPTTAAAYTGDFLAGVLFEVTTGGTWLEGYWWWVCPSGQPTAPQTFALWAIYSSSVGALVPAATVTSGTLNAGQWNYVPLATPVPLAPGVCYNAATGLAGGFPTTNNQYGAGDPYSAGIVSGPLSAFSDQSGSLPAPYNMPQGVFSVAGTDPTKYMPTVGYQSCNFWADLQVTTTPPTGATYRLWPSYPTLPGTSAVDTTGYTLATEFQLSKACTLDKIWFYSASGATALPTRCGIWSVSSQSEVAGTDNSAPAWSGPAGSGWVWCAYSGVTLPAGDYKVAVYSAGGSRWYQVTGAYWGTGGPGANGITAGPLIAPGESEATSPGQSSYNPGSWGYPLTYGTASNGENFWVDLEVTSS